MVAPTTGPRTTPSRTAMRPGTRVNSQCISENCTPPDTWPGAPATTRSNPGSPRTTKLRIYRVPSCGGGFRGGGGIAHPHPHLPAEQTRIHIGEPEQCTGVVGLEINDLMIVAGAHAQVAVERCVIF